ncbi:unnamed protein product [Blepharisma stoltei]|uniref:glycerol-3-phosphate dehydrogenase n=1 Tax=Blepharisma stoltei TaxID=1481888 RepID=A0AAU9JJI6_9CILI|nr:unnamed protein product [Blepharisma stoltei]
MIRSYWKWVGALAAGSGLRFLIYGTEPKTTREYTLPTLSTRQENIKALKYKEYDILVIGGGATGAGIALEAASRGLSCGLIERGDFASQTSSKSTKLLHGGVRYLEKAVKGENIYENLLLVSEALKERDILINSAPHMNKWLAISVPTDSYFWLLYYWVGLWVYHFIAYIQNCYTGNASTELPRPGISFESQTLIPRLKSKFKGSTIYYDGQMNDTRLCLEVLLTASSKGYIKGMVQANIANYCKAVSFIKKQGLIVGVRAEDLITGEQFDIKAKVVMNCTGVFSDSIRKSAGQRDSDRIVPAKGSHFLLPSSYTPNGYGLLIPKTTDGRVLFLLPWEGYTIAGTTDEKGTATVHSFMLSHEKQFLAQELSRFLNKTPEEISNDIKGSFSGERPLVKSKDEKTSSILRTHSVEVSLNGLISVMGGKWTTFRAMAENAVDVAVERFGLPAKYISRTRDMKLIGSQINIEELQSKLIKEYKISEEQAKYLVKEYGRRSEDVLKVGRNEQLIEGHPFTIGEIVYSTRSEYAEKPIDIIARRMRLALLDVKSAIKALDIVINEMGNELKWSKSKREQEYKTAVMELTQFFS